MNTGFCSKATPFPLNSRRIRRISAPTLIAGTRLMATTNPLQFIQQVRGEVAKVTWPSRREVVLTTIMVFIMAALTSVFFSLVDLGIRTGLKAIIGS
jgi:preprotein translocase subunit SecE